MARARRTTRKARTSRTRAKVRRAAAKTRRAAARGRRQVTSMANEGMRAVRKAANRVAETIKDLTPGI